MTTRALLSATILCTATTSGIAASDAPSFTHGPAEVTVEALFECDGANARVSAVGSIVADDGSVWSVPADTHFGEAATASDLYNECGGDRLGGVAELDLESVPVVDAGGSTTYTAYVFADNYFEWYVNGELVAIDPVPFTPFNSNVLRFRADPPFTVGVMMVDWEENLGLGSESNRGTDYHPGDGGLVAVVANAEGEVVNVTDGSWKARTFYTAPLPSPDCLDLDGGRRDSSGCATTSVADGSGFSAAHWPVPADWADPAFDDGDWPDAVTFDNATVGVDNKPAYTNFTDVFDDPRADAQFVWSSNLVLDNLVLLRTTID